MKPPGQDILFEFENPIWDTGIRFIAGLDEAGRGPLAGPVVAGCVVFPPRLFIEGVWDSKKLTALRREQLYELIVSNCIAYGVGIVDNQTIDEVNIYQATKLAMQDALTQVLTQTPVEHLQIDAMRLAVDIPQTSIIKGDMRSFTIAAASIIAKVERDRIMDRLHAEHPQYGWDKNRGYGTQKHRDALKAHGQCVYHRKSFKVK